MRKLLTLLIIVVIIYAIGRTARLFPPQSGTSGLQFPQLGSKTSEKQTILSEESAVTHVVEKSLPSVVTVGINMTTRTRDTFSLDPSNPFAPFRRTPGTQQEIKQNIGSGFVATSDGLIITNKHVVSETDATYTVLANDEKKYNVEKIYRDPLNDLAILKINATGLKPLPLGDSSKLKLGQIAIAIGTPLGEFTNSVTTGIVSGLGRGITAGSPYEGFVEKLDNIIQTDAAISPGNSGGPLLNSVGEVIGVNTAVSAEGQNIGFAIPVAIVHDLIDGFNKRGGTFEKPYIGVRYKIIDRQTAVVNELAEGAYIIEVVEDSPAQKAGLQVEDIITEFSGTKIKGTDQQTLTKLINEHKVGDQVKLKVWRNGEIKDLTITLVASP
ncbi:trypsin-like peptidase domain-containing protein [Candidatus Microgenomates bacterium]|nr:trypsin-like peptidase domain-containing protein [Candidatus Microgenomates bacterium]